MELKIDMERTLTDSEYAEHGPPDRKAETILRQELRDEIRIRSIIVRILVDDRVFFLKTIYPEGVPQSKTDRELTELPEVSGSRPADDNS